MGRSLSWLPEIKRVAVIGSSARTNYFFLRAFTSQFKGETIAIKPGVDHIEGFPNIAVYPRVKDIPGSLDFVFVSLPREKVAEIVRECAEKGVKLMSIFTSEFSDAGTEEGRALEKELLVGFRVENGNVGVRAPRLLVAAGRATGVVGRFAGWADGAFAGDRSSVVKMGVTAYEVIGGDDSLELGHCWGAL